MKEMKRVLALLLCFVMLVGYVPVGAFATEEDATAPSVEETIATEATDAAEETTEASAIETSVPEETEMEEVYVAEEEADSSVFSLGNVSMLASTSDFDFSGALDAAIIFSDLHAHDGTDYKKETLQDVMSTIATAGIAPSTVTGAGDMFSVNNDSGNSGFNKFTGKTSVLTGYIQGIFGKIPVNYVWSDHDRYAVQSDDKTLLDKTSRFVYGAGKDNTYGTEDDGNYYIYLLSMADLGTNDRYKAGFSSDSEVTAAISAFSTAAAGLKKDRPLFVVSHMPLYYNSARKDNGHALEWFTAINSVADTMDVAYFFGHNHNYDVKENYYYAKGSEVEIATRSSSNSVTSAGKKTLNFSHIHAGYMAPESSTSYSATTRTGVAIAAIIYEDKIQYVAYDADGIYDGHKHDRTYGQTITDAEYQLNKTVERKNPAAQPEPTVNTETYEDEFTIITAKSLGLTGIDVTYDERSFAQFGSNHHVAVDIALYGHTAGNEVEYTILAEEGTGENLSLFYVNADGTLEEVAFTSAVNEDGFQVLTFTTNKTGTFVYGTAVEVVPEGAVLTELTITGPEKINYFLSKAQVDGEEVVYLDITGLEVTAVYTHEGETYHKVLDWDEFGDVADGYALSFGDLSEFGRKTVTVSYGGKTASFEVNVCIDRLEVAFGEDKVSFEFEAPDVTDVSVTAAAAEDDVVSALEGLLTGNMVTYSINPTYVEGQSDLTDEVKVTLPIPAGVTNPQVYYVSDDYLTLEAKETTNNGDGTLTFTTDHFSTYVVGDSRAATAPESGWATITEPTGGTTTYTYTQADSITAGQKYVIVGNNHAFALMDNNGSMGAQSVTISGNTMTSTNTALTEWTFSGSSSGTIYNGTRYLCYYNNFSLNTNFSTNFTITDNGSNFRIQSGSRSFYYNGSSWARSGNNTAEYVRLYQLTNTTTSDGTDGLYGALGGKLTYAVSKGTSQADVIAAVKANTTVWYHTGELSGAQIYNSDEGMTWTIANYNANVPGDYTVTVKYNNVTLGTVKVTVLDKVITEAVFNPDSVTVERDTSPATKIGTVTLTYDDNSVETLDVTLDMLEGVDLRKNGTYDAYYVHEGQEVPGITVRVVNKTGVNDFPAYPNPGSVDLSKSATGLDFQNTGLARVELSTSGLPAGGVDVVVVIDTGSSMSGNRLKAAANAVSDMLTKFMDSYNTYGTDIDVAVVGFNGFNGTDFTRIDQASLNNSYRTTEDTAKIYTTTTGVTNTTYVYDNNDKHTLDAGDFLNNSKLTSSMIETLKGYFAAGNGTNYDGGLASGYRLLAAKKAANTTPRKQFVVFLSDGAGFLYNGFMSSNSSQDGTSDGRTTYNRWLTGEWESVADLKTAIENPDWNIRSSGYNKTTQLLRAEFYNGNGTNHPNRIAEAIKGTVGQDYTIVRAGAGETNNYMEQWPGLGATIYSIGLEMADDSNDGTVTEETLKEVINVISSGEGYGYPDATEAQLAGVFNTIAAEINLAASNARFVDQMGSAFELQMNPVQWSNNSKDGTVENITDITITSRSVYTQKDYEANKCTVDQIGQPYGSDTPMETVSFVFNNNNTPSNPSDDTLTSVTSSAKTGNILVGDVICAKYFFYNTTSSIKTITLADGSTYDLPGETFYWNIGTINEKQFALSYLVYLSGALDSGAGAPPADSYATNNFAVLYYDNYVGNEVSQSVPSPVLAWSGAHVSYAFYLVDSNGDPVYKDGSAAPNFYTAYKVTQPVVYSTVELNQNVNMIAGPLAADVLPEGYTLYAPDVSYEVGVASGNAQGAHHSYWEITNGLDATYVTGYGSATDYTNDAFVTTDSDDENVKGYDFTNTTVWFPVLWIPSTIPDAVVIDYGIPVDINALDNDQFGKKGTMTGFYNLDDALEDLVIENHEAVTLKTLNTIHVDEEHKLDVSNPFTSEYGKAQIVNGKVRYTPSNMEMDSYDRFVYEVKYDPGKMLQYYYGTITVIPATTVYYEDSFLDLKGYNNSTNAEIYNFWTQVGTNMNGIQDEDRPGQFSLPSVDANNIYGYDGAYTECSVYSQGSAVKAHVDADSYATATFDFYGTGFDVVSLTSNQTGYLVVQVKDASGNQVRNTMVNTYYGYTRNEWVQTTGENSLYQVPVIKIQDLPYGKYEAKIIATYNSYLDKTSADGYDLYLDAIRVYDPANNGAVDKNKKDTTIENAYKADGEGWPIYQEFRNLLIAASNYEVTENEDGTITITGNDLQGAIFIDGNAENKSIANYVSYGPNNEVYLANGQAVSFSVPALIDTNKIADVQVAMKSAHGGAVYVKLDVNGKESAAQISTATDLYYSIGSYLDKERISTITFTNTGDGILSLTNLKITFKEAPPEGAKVENYVFSNTRTVGFALARMRPPVVEEEIPEPTVPEETVPETTVPEETEPEETVPEVTEPEENEPEETLDADLQVNIRNKNIKVGSAVVVVAITSSDVDALSVNGKRVSHYVENRRTGVRTWTVNVKAEEAGDMDIEVTAYSAQGQALETVVEQITVTGKKASVVEQIIGIIIGVLLR